MDLTHPSKASALACCRTPLSLFGRCVVYHGEQGKERCPMSEQQHQTTTSATDEQDSAPDDSEPTPERQAELEAAYEQNDAAQQPPYKGVEFRTRGEVKWAIAKRKWSSDVRISSHPNFIGAYLSRVNLSGVRLSFANL